MQLIVVPAHPRLKKTVIIVVKLQTVTVSVPVQTVSGNCKTVIMIRDVVTVQQNLMKITVFVADRVTMTSAIVAIM